MYARTFIFLSLVAVLLLSSCQEKREDYFEREAREYTESHCPQQLDDVTRLDSLVYVKSEEEVGDLRFYYSVTFKEDTIRTEMMNHLGELGDKHLSSVRNSVIYIKQKNAGVSFTYIYHDAVSGDKIVEYHFTQKDYE